MSKPIKIRVPKRNTLAHVARMRRAPTMHDRRVPRGGSTQVDHLEGWEESPDDYEE